MLQIARSLGDQNLRAEAHYDLAMDALSAGDSASAQPHLNKVSNVRDANRQPTSVRTNSSVSSPTTAGTAGPRPSPSCMNTVSSVLPAAGRCHGRRTACLNR
jgi:hypothetical protein